MPITFEVTDEEVKQMRQHKKHPRDYTEEQVMSALDQNLQKSIERAKRKKK